MWQRFTEQARKVVFYAQEEAQRLNHNYVSTEHLLLGICREDSVAVQVLGKFGLSPAQVEAEIAKNVSKNEGKQPRPESMTLTPRGKRAIELGYDEARDLNNNYIGTEHLLLGLIREHDGLAGRVLESLGVGLEVARLFVIEAQAGGAKAAGDLDSLGNSIGGLLARMMRRHRRATPDLLAAVLLIDQSKRLWHLFSDLDLTLDEVLSAVSERLSVSHADIPQPDNDFQLVEVIQFAVEEAAFLEEPLGPEHFVPAIFRQENSHFSQYLRSRGVTLEAIRAAWKEGQE